VNFDFSENQLAIRDAVDGSPVQGAVSVHAGARGSNEAKSYAWGASIIMISSATATIMLENHAVYMVTKAGTDHVVRCVATRSANSEFAPIPSGRDSPSGAASPTSCIASHTCLPADPVDALTFQLIDVPRSACRSESPIIFKDPLFRDRHSRHRGPSPDLSARSLRSLSRG
jgi:hypothetical protein